MLSKSIHNKILLQLQKTKCIVKLANFYGTEKPPVVLLRKSIIMPAGKYSQMPPSNQRAGHVAA